MQGMNSMAEKYTLTIKEASEVFGIGQKKLYNIVDSNPNADFILMVGNRKHIKRRKFEQYIDEATVL